MKNRERPVDFYRDAMHMAFSEAGYPHAHIYVTHNEQFPDGDIGVRMGTIPPDPAYPDIPGEVLHRAYHVSGWVPVETCEMQPCEWRDRLVRS